MSKRRKSPRGGLALVLLLVSAAAGAGSTLLPAIPQAEGEACVEPTEVMRREHMNFLVHQRDNTVYGGIRGAKHSLVGCIDCHVQTDAGGAAVPINAEGQFCQSCHGFAGVRMDCFGCHATVPAAEQSHNGPNSSERADFGVIGSWRDDMKVSSWMEPPGEGVAATKPVE